jgi:N-acetylglucosamine kinase-like BadF-type ATPase
MVKAILGIDGGGTKTHAILVDLDGKILGTAANGGANWERIGIEAVGKSLDELINEVLSNAKISREDIVASTLALAGIDWHQDESLFAPVVQGLGLSGRCTLVNDSVAALFAGIADGIGCVSIAGTGGKTAGSDGEQTIQTMGMALGEGGGAGQLVDLALDSIARAHHGTAAKTKMYSSIPKAAGFDNPELFFIAIARGRVRLDESLAPLIFDLASSGDAIALDVVNRVAKQHAIDVHGIASRLNFQTKPITVIRAGGLHTAGCTVFDVTFEAEVKHLLGNVQVRTLDVAPVFGSVIYSAHKYFTTLPENFSSNLLTQARKVDL